MGAAFGKHSHDLVRYVERRHFDERNGLGGRDPHAVHGFAFDVVFFQHLVDPLPRARHQKDIDPHPVQKHQVPYEYRKQGVRNKGAFDRDDKRLAFELVDVPERLADDFNLFL